MKRTIMITITLACLAAAPLLEAGIPVVDIALLKQAREAFFENDGIIGQLKRQLEIVENLKNTSLQFQELVSHTLEKLSLDEALELLPFNTFIYLENAPFLFDPAQKEVWSKIYRRVETVVDLYHLLDRTLYTENPIYRGSGKTRRDWIDALLSQNDERLLDLMNLVDLAASTIEHQKTRAVMIKNWNITIQKFSSPYTYDRPSPPPLDFARVPQPGNTIFQHKLIYMVAQMALENLKQKTTRNMMLRAMMELDLKDRVRNRQNHQRRTREMESAREVSHVDQY